MMLVPELLASPAPGAARDIARDRLQKLLEAAARLEVRPDEPLASDPGSPEHPVITDAEAVHDFRVALRRLRTWLRAFRPWLEGTVTRRSERRFDRMWRRASAAREPQVESATLRELAEHGPEPIRSSAHALAAELTEKATRAQHRLTRDITRRLPKAAVRLAVQLEPVSTDPEAVAMRQVMAQLLLANLGKLEQSIARLASGPSLEQAHRVRICAKRLRYLLDAFGDQSRAARSAVRQLEKIQDAFGRLQDAEVLLMSVTKWSSREHAEESGPLEPLRQLLARRMRNALAAAMRVAASRRFASVHSATMRLVRKLQRDSPTGQHT